MIVLFGLRFSVYCVRCDVRCVLLVVLFIFFFFVCVVCSSLLVVILCVDWCWLCVDMWFAVMFVA